MIVTAHSTVSVALPIRFHIHTIAFTLYTTSNSTSLVNTQRTGVLNSMSNTCHTTMMMMMMMNELEVSIHI